MKLLSMAFMAGRDIIHFYPLTFVSRRVTIFYVTHHGDVSGVTFLAVMINGIADVIPAAVGRSLFVDDCLVVFHL